MTTWTAEAFAPILSEERCHALNGANAHALAVAFYEAKDRSSEPDDDQWRVGLVVRLGGGLSAATVMHGPHSRSRLSFVDARLISGTNGFAGELGHLPISEAVIEQCNDDNEFDDLAAIDYDGTKCSCGNLHHLDAFASGRGLAQRLKDSGYSIPTDGAAKAGAIKMALDGDIDQRQAQALEDIGRILGTALAGPVLMLDPHRLTLTGSLATEHVSEGVKRERRAWKNAIGDTVDVTPIGGHRGAFAGVHGSALAVIRRSVHRGYMDKGEWIKPPLDFGDKELGALMSERPIRRHKDSPVA